MAEAALTVKVADFETIINQTDELAAAEGDGNRFTWGPTTFLVVNNGSGGSINVTVDNPVSCAQSGTPADHDEVLPVPDGKIGIIDTTPERFKLASDGCVHVTYSAVGSVTVAACRLAGQT